MFEFDSRNDDGPVTWIRGYPLYAAHLIVVVLVASMLATAISGNTGPLAHWLPFTSQSVLNGQLWRVFTYGLYNPPTLWFVIEMAMIIWFGREVERTFGRRKFLALYAGLYLLTPLLYTVIGIWRPTSLAGQSGGFGLFIAFATLYPNVAMLFNILAKWLAFVLVGIYSLMAIGSRDWVSLISLWATTLFAFSFVRFEQGRLALPQFSLPARGPKLRVLQGEKRDDEPEFSSKRSTSMSEIDALLDKIAQSGLQSLTDEERAKLQDAREDLLKRNSARR